MEKREFEVPLRAFYALSDGRDVITDLNKDHYHQVECQTQTDDLPQHNRDIKIYCPIISLRQKFVKSAA